MMTKTDWKVKWITQTFTQIVMDPKQKREMDLKSYFAKSDALDKIPAYAPIPDHLKITRDETEAYLRWVNSRPCDNYSQKWCECVRERTLDD